MSSAYDDSNMGSNGGNGAGGNGHQRNPNSGGGGGGAKGNNRKYNNNNGSTSPLPFPYCGLQQQPLQQQQHQQSPQGGQEGSSRDSTSRNNQRGGSHNNNSAQFKRKPHGGAKSHKLLDEASYKNLFVARLPKSVGNDDLLALFAEFDAQSAVVMMDVASGTSKGFGFVTFNSEEEGQVACEAMSTRTLVIHDLPGRTLEIKASTFNGQRIVAESRYVYFRNFPAELFLMRQKQSPVPSPSLSPSLSPQSQSNTTTAANSTTVSRQPSSVVVRAETEDSIDGTEVEGAAGAGAAGPAFDYSHVVSFLSRFGTVQGIEFHSSRGPSGQNIRPSVQAPLLVSFGSQAEGQRAISECHGKVLFPTMSSVPVMAKYADMTTVKAMDKRASKAVAAALRLPVHGPPFGMNPFLNSGSNNSNPRSGGSGGGGRAAVAAGNSRAEVANPVLVPQYLINLSHQPLLKMNVSSPTTAGGGTLAAEAPRLLRGHAFFPHGAVGEEEEEDRSSTGAASSANRKEEEMPGGHHKQNQIPIFAPGVWTPPGLNTDPTWAVGWKVESWD